MSTELCTFWVPGPPQHLRRHRTVVRGGKVRTYDSQANKDAKLLVQQYANIAFSKGPVAGPLVVYLTFNVLRPKSAPTRAWPSVRPDIDNYIKLVLDALTGVVWVDDDQVTELHAQKMYALSEPGTSVHVNRKPDTETHYERARWWAPEVAEKLEAAERTLAGREVTE